MLTLREYSLYNFYGSKMSPQIKEVKNLKIAMPYAGGYIHDKFGQSEQYIIIEAEDKEITGSKIITTGSDRTRLVATLQEEGVNYVIANMVSRPLHEMLYYSGMEVILGATGEVEDVARTFLAGKEISQGTRHNRIPGH
jgi:predicted Fe-Mo cluster-binding NifX family protein